MIFLYALYFDFGTITVVFLVIRDNRAVLTSFWFTTVDFITICLRDLQPLNAFFSIDLIFFPITTLESLVQFLNASVLIDVTL